MSHGENIVAYTLRHTAATRACTSGVPDRVLADLMGHTSTNTTRRYQHPQLEHLADAIKQARLARILRNEDWDAVKKEPILWTPPT